LVEGIWQILYAAEVVLLLNCLSDAMEIIPDISSAHSKVGLWRGVFAGREKSNDAADLRV
jgi:hypothetical protein